MGDHMTAHAPHKPGAAGKMSLVVHSTLADVPFTVELAEPTALHLRQYVGAQYNYRPEDLRMFFENKQLPPDGPLAEAGIKDGDQIAVLHRRNVQDPPGSSEPEVPLPDRTTVDAVTAEEAKARGNPPTGREPPPATARHGHGPGGMEQQLMGLLSSVQDYMHMSAHGVEEEEGEEGEEAELQVPEPDAEGLVQLQDMGFSAGLAAKALLLSRNVAAAALDWALQHADDPDADAPPTEDALRAVWQPTQRRRRPRPGGPADPQLVEQLVDMGFDRDQAAEALQNVDNSLELACQWLLAAASRSDDDGTPGGARGAQRAHQGEDAMEMSGSEDGNDDGEHGGGDEEGEDMSEWEEDHGEDESMSEGDGSDLSHPLSSVSGDEDEEDMIGRNAHPAEDDFEHGLQDMQGPEGPMVDFGMGGMEGLWDMQEVLARLESGELSHPELMQEVASSPALIDAVQALLQNSAASATLVHHPEMAPYIRALRRLVGMDVDADQQAAEPQAAAQPAATAAADPGSDGAAAAAMPPAGELVAALTAAANAAMQSGSLSVEGVASGGGGGGSTSPVVAGAGAGIPGTAALGGAVAGSLAAAPAAAGGTEGPAAASATAADAAAATAEAMAAAMSAALPGARTRPAAIQLQQGEEGEGGPAIVVSIPAPGFGGGYGMMQPPPPDLEPDVSLHLAPQQGRYPTAGSGSLDEAINGGITGDSESAEEVERQQTVQRPPT